MRPSGARSSSGARDQPAEGTAITQATRSPGRCSSTTDATARKMRGYPVSAIASSRPQALVLPGGPFKLVLGSNQRGRGIVAVASPARRPATPASGPAACGRTHPETPGSDREADLRWPRCGPRAQPGARGNTLSARRRLRHVARRRPILVLETAEVRQVLHADVYIHTPLYVASTATNKIEKRAAAESRPCSLKYRGSGFGGRSGIPLHSTSTQAANGTHHSTGCPSRSEEPLGRRVIGRAEDRPDERHDQ